MDRGRESEGSEHAWDCGIFWARRSQFMAGSLLGAIADEEELISSPAMSRHTFRLGTNAHSTKATPLSRRSRDDAPAAHAPGDTLCRNSRRPKQARLGTKDTSDGARRTPTRSGPRSA